MTTVNTTNHRGSSLSSVAGTAHLGLDGAVASHGNKQHFVRSSYDDTSIRSGHANAPRKGPGGWDAYYGMGTDEDDYEGDLD